MIGWFHLLAGTLLANQTTLLLQSGARAVLAAPQAAVTQLLFQLRVVWAWWALLIEGYWPHYLWVSRLKHLLPNLITHVPGMF